MTMGPRPLGPLLGSSKPNALSQEATARLRRGTALDFKLSVLGPVAHSAA